MATNVSSMFSTPREQPRGGRTLTVGNLELRQIEVSMKDNPPNVHLKMVHIGPTKDAYINQYWARILAEYFTRLEESLSSENTHVMQTH